MFGILRFIRGFCGFIFAMQIVSLFSALSWLQQPSAITGNMLAMLFIKLIALVIFGAAFIYGRKGINYLYNKKHGIPHPSLATKWSL